jgi:opacity protein-like surface antigen
MSRSGSRALPVALVLLVAGLAVAPAPVAAQARGDLVTFGLGIHGGVAGTTDSEASAITAGVHARFRLLQFVALEAAVDYRTSEYLDQTVEVSTVPLTASVLLYPFQIGPLQPYLVGGVGWYLNSVDIQGGRSEDTNRFGVHLGFGLDLAVTPEFVLHGDFRYVFMDATSDGIKEQVGEFDTDGWMVTVGLTWYFR